MVTKPCLVCKADLDASHVADLCDRCLFTSGSQHAASGTTQVTSDESESTSAVPPVNDPSDMCLPGCTIEDKRKGTVQCLLCRKPYHKDCVSTTVYVCDACRVMPQQINTMYTLMQNMTQSVSNLLQMCTDLKTENTALRDQASTQLDLLRTENSTLRQQITDLARDNSTAAWQKFPKAHGTLLLGSSLIRDVDQEKLVSTECVSKSGGKIRDALSHLDSLPRNETYERVILVTAGNDCDQSDSPVEIKDLVDQYRDLVKAAKSHANKVTISSIPPRDRTAEVTARITAMNTELLNLSQELSVEFVDSTPGFFLSDGCLNDGYLLDGVHFKPAGTHHLVTKLGLKLRPGLNSAHSYNRRRRQVSGDDTTPDVTPQANESQNTYGDTFWNRSWQKVQHRNRRPNHAHSQQPPRHAFPQTPSVPLHRNTQTNRPRGPPPMPRGQSQTLPHSQPFHRKQHQQTQRPTPLMDIHIPRTNVREVPPTTRGPSQNAATKPGMTQQYHEETRCQLCSGRGHSASVCRSRVTTCHNCGVVGHYARQCPNVNG